MPRISVITVLFNAEKLIENTIKSILAQTYPHIEYLIIDGQSSDKTMEIVSRYQKDINTIISEPDSGIYDAMNKGLRKATGDYVLFLNAGDLLENESTLASVFSQIDQLPDVIYGETHIVDDAGKVLGTRSELTTRKLPAKLKVRNFLKGQVVSHQAFIPKRSLCPSFNLRYQCSADTEWMIDTCERASSVFNANTTISRYLMGGVSDRLLKKCWLERARIMLNHFDPISVMYAHLIFALRYLRYGAYKSDGRSVS